MKTMFALVLFSSVCSARPDYVRRVPTRYGCETCHLDPRNRNLRTGFGIDYGLSRGIWAVDEDPMAGICNLDSDSDGLSNGAELGDPDCLWRIGNRLPAASVSNPANDLDPDQCGDGIRQGGEACDGADLAEEACGNQGFLGGEVSCSPACQLDFSDCIPIPPADAGRIDAALHPDQGLDLGMLADSAQNAGLIDGGVVDEGLDTLGDIGEINLTRDADPQIEFDGEVTADSMPILDAGRRGEFADSSVTPAVRGGDGCQMGPGQPSIVFLVLCFGLIRLFRRGDR